MLIHLIKRGRTLFLFSSILLFFFSIKKPPSFFNQTVSKFLKSILAHSSCFTNPVTIPSREPFPLNQIHRPPYHLTAIAVTISPLVFLSCDLGISVSFSFRSVQLSYVCYSSSVDRLVSSAHPAWSSRLSLAVRASVSDISSFISRYATSDLDETSRYS